MNKILISILFIALLSACKEDKTPKKIEKNGVKITLPGFVKEDELSDDAFIEYANRFRNFYVAAFILSDTIPNDSLWIVTTRRVCNSLEHYTVDSSSIDGAILTKIKGNFKDEKEPIFYTQKLISNKDKRVLLTVWTRGDERYKKHTETIDKIVSSFMLNSNHR